jgi:predicted permease
MSKKPDMHFERWFRVLRLRLWSLFRPRRVEQELDEEIHYHIDRQVQEFIAKGLTPEEARYAALRKFNAVDQRREECRDVRGVRFVENLGHDIRYALRSFVKNPGFTCAAILALSLGIGANAAMFTMVNSVLIRRLPFKNADRLVWVWSTRTDRDKAFYSIPNFIDTREQMQTLEDIAAFANWGVNMTGSGEAERLTGVRISANAFQMLGVDATVGRTLLPADGRPEANRVVVISNGLWRRRFGADPHVVGRSLLLNGTTYTLIGILPPEFTLPNAEVDIASALIIETDSQRSDRGSNFLRTFALLKPGVTVTAAQADLATITERLKRLYPDDNAKHTPPRVLALLDEVVGNYHALLWTLLGAVVIVLLVACTNLANMLLVRSAGRKREFAIRTALGGTRAQLARELTIASLLLAAVGGSLGVLVGTWGVRLLVAIGPADLPRISEIALDWRVLAFTACISLAVGVVFGLAPVVQARRIDINDALRGSGRSSDEHTPGVRVRRLLVIWEVALCLLLLIGAGLLVRSFIKLQSVNSGVDARNVLSIRLSLPATKYLQTEVAGGFVNRLVQNVRMLPGVKSASIGSVLPLSGMNTRADFSIAGRPPATEAERPAAQNRWIAPDYFGTLGIRLLHGRDFTDLDTQRTQPVVIIDEALMHRHFADQNPIGMHLRVTDAGPNAREVEIVGVVGSVKHFNLDDPPTPSYYSPAAQIPPAALGFFINGMSLVMRTEADPMTLADTVRREIQSLDKDVPASAVRTMDDLLAASVAPRRFNLLLIEIFAIAAVVLAAMGLYSVIAYTVAQRRLELGIRMALGASAGDVLALVLREGMLLVAFGEGIGLVAAFVTTRFLSGLLFGITPTDPLTFVSISIVLTATAFLACYIPARRATRVNPMLAVRHE